MNILEACAIDTPFDESDDCSKFVIDDVLNPFVLRNVMNHGDQYTISLWIKTDVPEEVEAIDEPEDDANMSILIRGATMPVTREWTYHKHTFSTYGVDLKIFFNAVGTYYIYHPQLERGSVATDWAESPLDTDNKIKEAKDTADSASAGVQQLQIKLEESIQMLVTSINNGTLLEQTDEGWNFITEGGSAAQLKAISDALSKLSTTTSADIEELKKAVGTNAALASYVKIGETNDDPPKPMIELGTVDSETNQLGEFRLRITDTAIQFMQWGNPIAYISNQQLYIEKTVIKQELSISGFILKKHGTRNNVGFLWKGVTG